MPETPHRRRLHLSSGAPLEPALLDEVLGTLRQSLEQLELARPELRGAALELLEPETVFQHGAFLGRLEGGALVLESPVTHSHDGDGEESLLARPQMLKTTLDRLGGVFQHTLDEGVYGSDVYTWVELIMKNRRFTAEIVTRAAEEHTVVLEDLPGLETLEPPQGPSHP